MIKRIVFGIVFAGVAASAAMAAPMDPLKCYNRCLVVGGTPGDCKYICYGT
jgi:hypothetical protein